MRVKRLLGDCLNTGEVNTGEVLLGIRQQHEVLQPAVALRRKNARMDHVQHRSGADSRARCNFFGGKKVGGNTDNLVFIGNRVTRLFLRSANAARV